MKVTVIPIVVEALGKVPKDRKNRLRGLEIRGRMETFQTIAVIKSAKSPRRVLDHEKICCRSDSGEKTLIRILRRVLET